MLARELDLAACMAAQSCEIMLWQQALASEKHFLGRRLAKNGMRELRKLDKKFEAYWPLRNKGPARNCSAFLRWRIEGYQKGGLPGLPKTTT
jgi:hypothetical protein